MPDTPPVATSRFQAQGGGLATAVTLSALSAEAPGGWLAAVLEVLEGLGAVVSGW
jgi:hypothetical protein